MNIMKEIFILRHAKSSWKDSYLSDFDRPLADRGIREAKKLCGFIKKNSFNIDKVICSNAKRALETFYLVADGFNFEIEKATYTNNLYFGEVEDIVDTINELGDDIKKILIIGHNPTLHTLTEMLTNEHINRFTTCNLAKISFEGKWKTLAPSKCSLISIIKPKEMIN